MKNAFRLLSLGAMTLLACLPIPGAALAQNAAQGETIRLTADHIEFYYDRFLIEADGNVDIRTSDGLHLTGRAFSMDVKLNRFVLAGGVHVDSPAGSQDGAALADFLDFKRVYFVPVSSEPDRWTFVDNDFTHPQKGREMPGDTFFFPDLGDAKPFYVTREAVVGPQDYVRFGSGQMALAGAYIPEPSFYVNFSRNTHMAENSLAGAEWDATYQFAGTANSISALHLRYDPQNKGYASFEQHIANDKAYAVFSINPMTRPSKFYDVVLGDQPSKDFGFRSFTQFHTLQYGLGSPVASSHFSFVQLVKAFNKHSLELDARFDNFSLNKQSQGYFNPHHDSYLTLTDSTFDHCIWFNKFCTRERAGLGFVHDPAGLQTIGATTYTHTSNSFAGLTAYVPSFALIPNDNPDKRLTLNAYVDKQRTWYASPSHAVDQTNTSASLSRILDPGTRRFTAYTQYNVQNLGDFYAAGLSQFVYPIVESNNGVIDPGYASFKGQATFRTWTSGLVFTNGPDFSFAMTYRHHRDFPTAKPGFFTLPADTYFQPSIAYNYLGQPPNDLTADLRFRLNPHMSLDFQRTYFFNYQNMRWSPQFRFQVGP